jgi:hypothetical protein
MIGYHFVQLKDPSVKLGLTSEKHAAGFGHEAIASAKTADDVTELLQAEILQAVPDWQDPWFFARPAERPHKSLKSQKIEIIGRSGRSTPGW